MSIDTSPTDIAKILARPRSEWTDEDIDTVFNWLRIKKFRHLLGKVFLYLFKKGISASTQQAEEVLAAFFSGPLFGVIKNYKPEKGPFWNYLSVSLNNFCKGEADKIHKINSVEVPMEVKNGFGVLITLDIADPTLSPEEQSIIKERQRKVMKCLESLPTVDALVIVLKVFEGMDDDEISKRLQMSKGAIKKRRYDARIKLAKRLQKEGLAS